jgi:predicted hotdog family 3-hydroxylacyl-ACP dehydratase
MASPEEIIAGEFSITRYIPQKEPMVMIGKLHSTGEGKTVSSYIIPEDNIFCENGYFLEAGIIENMAQTAAAGTGYMSKLENRPPPVGFIGGIKNLKIESLPRTGDEIVTEITIEHQVFDATIAHGRVYLQAALIAECELKIFLLNS